MSRSLGMRGAGIVFCGRRLEPAGEGTEMEIEQ